MKLSCIYFLFYCVPSCTTYHLGIVGNKKGSPLPLAYATVQHFLPSYVHDDYALNHGWFLKWNDLVCKFINWLACLLFIAHLFLKNDCSFVSSTVKLTSFCNYHIFPRCKPCPWGICEKTATHQLMIFSGLSDHLAYKCKIGS